MGAYDDDVGTLLLHTIVRVIKLQIFEEIGYQHGNFLSF
jgi:hypothetical protein